MDIQTQWLCIAPTKKATSKTASELWNWLSAMQFYMFLQDKFATPVSTFPILFTYKGAGIWLFSVSGFSISVRSYFFSHFSVSSHHYFPNPRIPDSPLWLYKGERRACILTKLSDQWHVLISSALVSLSCLIKQWPFPPSIYFIPTVPKCTSAYFPEDKNKH